MRAKSVKGTRPPSPLRGSREPGDLTIDSLRQPRRHSGAVKEGAVLTVRPQLADRAGMVL